MACEARAHTRATAAVQVAAVWAAAGTTPCFRFMFILEQTAKRRTTHVLPPAAVRLRLRLVSTVTRRATTPGSHVKLTHNASR